ncbi:helix-turn-helix domain-containing protein [Caulobacter soli]|uniref:helix-turn-helix domain-containing protein n=1 Tax=Caulobacter soli TaxID=2708539 RepID=UPI0013ED9C50|nr:helix-turn-helix domain-containing protein [Caulobacter soli]
MSIASTYRSMGGGVAYAVGAATFAAHDVSNAPPRWCAADLSQNEIVDRISRFVQANLGLKSPASVIVKAVGVSESRLRRVILMAAGMTLGGFVLELKLLQAHAWLSSNRELRSQREIIAALGLRSVASFSRAYGRRFGESMTATRRRAVTGAAPQPVLQDNGDARLDIIPCKYLSVQGL